MYRQVKQVGRGAFGEGTPNHIWLLIIQVWLCTNENKQKVALKFVPCDQIHRLNEATKEVRHSYHFSA